MAVDTIRRLFFVPPIAIARLGGSTRPLDAFDWGPGDPHLIAETRVRPTWTLDVLSDGRVSPRLPRGLTLRDGGELRPVAPFLELWALVGDGPPEAWTPSALTPALLQANGASTAALSFEVVAMNGKASRRTGNPAHRFGTFPAVRIGADDHRPTTLRGESPPEVVPPLVPMIPRGRHIALGQVQVLRPVAPPQDPPWPATVLVDVVRLRFTPSRGRFYGPPQAATSQPPAVTPDRAFLDPAAGWFNAAQSTRVIPADTVDTFGDRSLGVVDDACDARVSAELDLAGGVLRCHANVAAGPPHFAPDRRPFLSIADETNDRQHDPGRDAALSPADRSAWVEDLFERVFETLSLMNVDRWRLSLGQRPLPPEARRAPIPDDGVPDPDRAMGATDRLRDPNVAIPAPSRNAPLPVSQRARERHRKLSDIRELHAWVQANPGRLRQLVRPPFARQEWESRFGQSMQMPPFMNNSNPGPLSLARWQYDLLMSWMAAVTAPGAPAPGDASEAAPGGLPPGTLRSLSPPAARRRDQVLAALTEDHP